jgi:hypothetical protein
MPNRNREKGSKLAEPEKFKLADILYGLVVPLLIGILIIAFPAVIRPALDAAFPAPDMMTGAEGSPYAFITVILTHGFAQMIILGVPLILGLLWNKWAGGAAGFLTGTLYYVAWAGYNTQFSVQIAVDAYYAMGNDPNMFIQSLPPNLWADPSFIGSWIVGGILIGYITGALNNKSMSFKRMLGAALTAAITVGIIQFTLSMTVAAGAWMAQADPGFTLFTVMLPAILLGIIGPILAKVMTWYGLMPGNRY